MVDYSKEQLKISAATHFPSGHLQWSIRLSGVEDRIFLVCFDLNAKKLGKKSELVKREKSCLSVRYLMFFWSYMLHKSLYIWWTRQWNNNIPKTVSPTVQSWEKNYWTLIFMPFSKKKEKKKRNPFYDIQDVTKLSKTFLTHRKAAMTDSGV